MVVAPLKRKEAEATSSNFLPIRNSLNSFTYFGRIRHSLILISRAREKSGGGGKKRCSCQARAAKRINFQRRDRRATKIISGTTASTATAPEELSGKRGARAVNLYRAAILFQEC